MNKMLQSLKLSLLHVGHARLDAAWDYDNVISPFSRIYLCTEGGAKIFHSYLEVELRPGHLYLVPSFTYSRYRCVHYHEQFYLHFLEEVGEGRSIYDLKDFIYEKKASDDDLRYYNRLMELHPDRKLNTTKPEMHDNRKAIALIEKKNEHLSASSFLETQALLKLLFSNFIQNSNSTRAHIRSDFHEVLTYIKKNLHEKLSVSDLAGQYNLSADHFSRVFQQKFGVRPSKYIQHMRIERSETLLLTTNKTLAEIAERTGWDNVSYYARVFKRINHKTPGEFRKKSLL